MNPSYDELPNSDINKELHDAVTDKNLYLVQKLLSEGHDVNGYYLGMTPLHIAAKKLNSLLFDSLVNSGANLELKDKDGRTPAFNVAISIGKRMIPTSEKKELFEKFLSHYSPNILLVDNSDKDPLSYLFPNAQNKFAPVFFEIREKFNLAKKENDIKKTENTFRKETIETFTNISEQLENISMDVHSIANSNNKTKSVKEITPERYVNMDIDEMVIIYNAYKARIKLYEGKLESKSSFCELKSRIELMNKLCKVYQKTFAMEEAAKLRGIESLTEYLASSKNNSITPDIVMNKGKQKDLVI
jgi:ankyrin repeat protein